MKTIKVKGCKDCKFASIPEVLGWSTCRIGAGKVNLFDNTFNGTLDNCPLKKEPIKIELDNENRS